MELDFKPHFI